MTMVEQPAEAPAEGTRNKQKKRPRRPTLNHYILKAQILESIVNGTKATALCGIRYRVQPQGRGVTSAEGADTCVVCQDIYDGLRP